MMLTGDRSFGSIYIALSCQLFAYFENLAHRITAVHIGWGTI